MRQPIYITNDSFPELREVRPWWRRSSIWFRAILRAMRDGRFWMFVIVQVTIVAHALMLGPMAILEPWMFMTLTVSVGLIALTAYLQVSWGGDIMRSHLRAVNEIARHACPSCGHDLRGHLDEGDAPIICSECGASVARAIFEPPYPIPFQYRAFPPWRPAQDDSSFGE